MIAGAAAAAAFAVAAVASAQEPTPAVTPEASPSPAAAQELRLDFSVTDPDQACTGIDSSYRAAEGEEFTVAVCLLNAPEPPAVVRYTVLYDDRVILAPNIGACDGDVETQTDLFDPESPSGIPSREESLDCNPDANAGRTTFGTTSLGEGFDCTSGVTEPWGNREGPTGDAWNGGCISAAGPYTLAPSAPVALITFRAVSEGMTALTFFDTEIVGASGIGTGTCNPVKDIDMRCYGGEVHVSGGDPLEDIDDDDGGGVPWTRIGLGAGFALLFVFGLLLWWRRPRRERPAA
jgi:hypothetical protein